MERSGRGTSRGMQMAPAVDDGDERLDKESRKDTQETKWKTAGERSKKTEEGGAAAGMCNRSTQGQAASYHIDKKLSPRKQMKGGRISGSWKKKSRGKGGASDPRDGSATFTQLKSYLAQGAPLHYVLPLVERISTLARERRFQAYTLRVNKNGNKQEDVQRLKEQWQDKPTAEQQVRYQKLNSYWNLLNQEHGWRLYQWMKEWIVQDDLSQSEVEARLQFCHFETNVVHEEAETKAGVDSGSYLGAVHKGMTALGDGLETEEQRRMKQLCMQPAQSVTKLRARTEDEDKALLMILNHEIEVPGPPAFLKQSMTSTELAYFTDIFLAIEYPLYAHLAPGQQFGQNMSRHAIMRHIYAGPEAAPSHKQEVEEFKEAFSLIALNADTRVVTITFKGRQSAAKWVNWRLPLASKFLTLVDYDGQRERARTTHELVRLDYYDFTVAARKGEVTSRDMHWILAHGRLGLQVQEMTHPDASSKGLNDKEWRVTVKGAQCPQILRSTTFIETEQAAVMIHHHTIHVNWPCATCHSPEHPTKYCKMEAEAIEQQRKLFDMRLTGTLPSADDNGGNGLAKGSLPTTLEQLREILTKGAYPSRSRVSNKKDGRSKPKSLKRRTQSPSKKITHGDTCGPSLPIEWEQHRRPGGTTGITSGDPPRSKPEKDEGWQNGERGLQQQPDATPRVDGPINGTYPAEATNHGVQKELEVHHKDDGIEVVQQEVDYEMGEVGEEDQGEKVDDKEASMSPAGKSKHPADGDDPRGRSPTRRILRRGAPGRRHSTNTDGMSRSGEKQPDPEDASGSRGRAERGEASEETHTARDRTESKSPKRRGREDSDSETGGVKKEMCTTPMAVKITRPLSPIKRGPNSPRKKDRLVQQKYMHQYLLTKKHVNDQDMSLQDVDEARTESQPVQSQRQRPVSTGAVKNETPGTEPNAERKNTESDECKYVGSRPANDAGAPLENWIAILGGNLVDVAATGHCGWLAGYAALYNVAEGMYEPTVQVIEAANAFKKQVLNGMLATLEEEMRLHMNDLDVELEASGIRSLNGAPVAKRICALANHYVAQRQKSVKAAVPMHFWVRPAHIKAMAIHARETIYVLDVDEHGTTRAQTTA